MSTDSHVPKTTDVEMHIRKHYLDLHEQREREKIESAKRQLNGWNIGANGKNRRRSDFSAKPNKSTPQPLRPFLRLENQLY